MITPYIPTPEELAEAERLSQLPAPGAAPGHTHSTGGSPAVWAPPGTPHAAPYPYAPAQAAPYAAYPAPYAPYPPAQAAPAAPQPRPPLAQFVLTAEQLEALVIPPRPALLDQWLCQGDLGYIYAPRGVGKTWMAMALPGAISCRRPLGLWAAAEPTPSSSDSDPSSDSPSGAGADSISPSASGQADADPAPDPEAPPAPEPVLDHIPVLYIDGEMALEHTKYRARGLDLSKVHHLHHEHLFNQNGTCLNIGEVEDRKRITDLIVGQGYQVLILDNLSALASGVDENKGMDYEPLSHWLLELRRRKITVMVVHHAGRNGMMRGHSKREDACSWIIELRGARQDGDRGAKFVSHFTKPSRNTGEPLPDMLWHFTTDKKTGITDIRCELSVESDYEQFIQHVCEGVTAQVDIAEMMGKHRGCISKWATRALSEGRISGSPRRLQPPAKRAKTRVHANDDDDDESPAEFGDDD